MRNRRDNERILREFVERVWNGKELGAVPGFVDGEYTVLLDAGDPWEGKTLDNAEYVKRLGFVRAFPGHAFRHTVGRGGRGSCGRQIKAFGATIYRFKNGKVSGHSQVFDRTAVMRQLGYIK